MKNLFLLLFLIFNFGLIGQTVDNPVLIEMTSVASTIAPGQKSALIVSFKIPKGLLLGAAPGESRTPPATIIKPVANAGFTFGTPQFPEAFTEGVPAKLGTTKAYKETFTVIVPYLQFGFVL